MPGNYVTVQFLLVNPDASPVNSNAHLIFKTSDIVWAAGPNFISAIPSVEVRFEGGSPPPSIDLFAMDLPGVSTNWYWIFTGTLLGHEIPARKLIVNLAGGDPQQLGTLLNASTLI